MFYGTVITKLKLNEILTIETSELLSTLIILISVDKKFKVIKPYVFFPLYMDAVRLQQQYEIISLIHIILPRI